MSIFAQAWWLDAVCGPENWDVILVRKGGEIVAALPLCFTDRYKPLKVRMPILTARNGLWINYPTDQKTCRRISFGYEVMDVIINSIEAAGVCSYMQQFPYSFDNWLPFHWRNYSQSTRYSYVIDGLDDLDAVYANFDTGTRKNIRKAEKKVMIREGMTVNDFYRLNKMTFSRQGAAMPYGLETVARIDAACVENNCRRIFYAVDADGNIHAALYLVWDKESAYYLMGGSDPRFRSSEAFSLLMWSAIRFVAGIVTRFDFEGSMLPAIEKFIRGFGGTPLPYSRISKEYGSPWVNCMLRFGSKVLRKD